MRFPNPIDRNLKNVDSVRPIFRPEQLKGAFSGPLEFAPALAERIIRDNLRGKLRPSRPFREQCVRRRPFRIVPSECVHFQQITLLGEASSDIPMDDILLPVRKRESHAMESGRVLRGERCYLFLGGSNLLRGYHLEEETAQKFAPLRFERPAERFVGEDNGRIRQKTTNKIRTGFDDVFILTAIGRKKNTTRHPATSVYRPAPTRDTHASRQAEA